jgi:hypothetical protein
VIQKVEQIMQAESVPALKAVAALEQFRALSAAQLGVPFTYVASTLGPPGTSPSFHSRQACSNHQQRSESSRLRTCRGRVCLGNNIRDTGGIGSSTLPRQVRRRLDSLRC